MNTLHSSPKIPKTAGKTGIISSLTMAIAMLATSACSSIQKNRTHRSSDHPEVTQSADPIVIVNLPSSPEQTIVNNIQATIEDEGDEACDIVKLSRTFSKMYQEKYGHEPENFSIQIVKPFPTNMGVAYMKITFMKKGVQKTLYICAHRDSIPVNMTPREKEPLVVEMTGQAFAERFIDKNRQRYAQNCQNILRLKLHALTKKLPLEEALRKFEEYARGDEAGLLPLGFEVLVAQKPTRNNAGQEIIQLLVRDTVDNTTIAIPFDHVPNRIQDTLSNSDQAQTPE